MSRLFLNKCIPKDGVLRFRFDQPLPADEVNMTSGDDEVEE
jgi:hypothetical protein